MLTPNISIFFFSLTVIKHLYQLTFYYIIFFESLLTLYETTKFLDYSKFKAFADNKIILTHKLQFVLERVENNEGNRENAGCLHFLLFPQCFQTLSFLLVLKVGIV